MKRKTRALEASDSEQSTKPPSPEPPRGAKLKGRVIFSDDDESDEPKPHKGKGKASAQSSDVEELERSVRAMMDIDDGDPPFISHRIITDTLNRTFRGGRESHQGSHCSLDIDPEA